MFDFFKRKKKSEIKNELSEEGHHFLHDEETSKPFLDIDTHEPVIIEGKPQKRRFIDIVLFTKIQRAIALKNARKFYRSEAQIAKKFKVGTTTIRLVRLASEAKHTRTSQYKHYKELRADTSGSTRSTGGSNDNR